MQEQSYGYYLGSDEVGRGCIAGPLVCCSVLLPFSEKHEFLRKLEDIGVRDSKKLTSLRRKNIAEDIAGASFFENTFSARSARKKNYYFYKKILPNVIIAVSVICVDFIERHNILKSSLYGMRKSGRLIIENNKSLSQEKVFWGVDGNKVWSQRKNKDVVIKPIIKGDSKVRAIGAASIIAKYFRDKLMTELSEDYLGYGFEKHFGYPTEFHRTSIKRLGASTIHRESFKLLK